jgi:CheY-like chemotaxis protein
MGEGLAISHYARVYSPRQLLETKRDAMSMLLQERPDFLPEQPNPLQVILVAVAHTGLRETIVAALADDSRFYVHPVSSSLEAIEATRDCLPDLLILDYYLSPAGGMALSDRLHRHPDMRQVPTIILSDRRPHEVREIERRGLLSLGRPFELADLLALLDQALPAPCPQSVLG